MDSSGFIILLFNRMAAAPHDVPVFFQDEELPEVMGEVIMGNDGVYVLTTNHYHHRVDDIKSKIRELYTLEPDDNIVPTNVAFNRIDYKIFLGGPYLR